MSPDDRPSRTESTEAQCKGRVAARPRVFMRALCLLALAALLAPAAAGAKPPLRHLVSPLPQSAYAVRAICSAPAPRHAACLAFQLLAMTAAARAHNHPIGRPLLVPGRAPRPSAARSARGAAAVAATGVCEPAKAAEGCYGLRPQDLHSAYLLPQSAPIAQTIAIVDAYDDPSLEADLKVYDEEFGLPPCTHADGCLTKVNQQGAESPLPKSQEGWTVEISLDVETVHAICESCKIVLVEAGEASYVDLEAAEETAVGRMGANEVSNSWAGPEPLSDSTAFEHPGTVITAAAGDAGYLNWDSSELEARGQVSYPASSPHVVAVGGTRLSLATTGAWAAETVWNGGKYSLTVKRGATGSGCSAHYEAPVWQRELPNWSSVGCGSSRAVADISADADPYTGVAVYDSSASGWMTVGGTSLSSPLIAATFALAGGSGGAEYPARTLYQSRKVSPEALHDIQTGSNGKCSKSFEEDGLSGCSATEEAESCSQEAICLAGAGYDGPTGLGSPDGIDAFTYTSSEPERAAQEIEFTSVPPSGAKVGGPSYTVTAQASSGLAVSFSPATPSVCLLSGSSVTFTGAGDCAIDALQAGNAEYMAAPMSVQHVTVGRDSQQLEFTSSPPTTASVGAAAYEAQARSSSGLIVSLRSGAPSVCAVTGRQVSLLATGECLIEAVQEGNSNYLPAGSVSQSFTVGRGSQRIVFTSPAPGSARIGGAPYEPSASASSGLPVSLSSASPTVCSISGSSVSFLAAGECVIDAAQEGDSDYLPAPSASQSFPVGKLTQQVGFETTAPSTPRLDTGEYEAVAHASSGLPVTLSSSTEAVCSVTGTAVSLISPGTCVVKASQEGDGEYEAAPAVTRSFVVQRALQSVEFTSAAPAAAIFAGTPYALAATSSSGLPVSFSSSTPSVCAVEGLTVEFTGTGECVLGAGQHGGYDYEPAAQAQQSFAVAAPKQSPTSEPQGSGTAGEGSSTSKSTGSGTGGASTATHGGGASKPRAAFVLLGRPKVHRGTARIGFRARLRGRGRLTWRLILPRAASKARSRHAKRCARRSKCARRPILFAKGRRRIAHGGKITVTVGPSHPALAALRRAGHRRAWKVKAIFRFRPAGVGAIVRRASVKVRLSSRRGARSAHRGAHSHRRRPRTLSLAAAAAISARIGRRQSAFAPRRTSHGYALKGGGIALALGAGGARIAAHGGSAAMRLAAIGRGEHLQALGRSSPQARRHRVLYRAAGVREWFAAGPLGIEQGFTIAKRPSGSGPLTISLSVSGSLHARRAGRAVDLVDREGGTVVRYGGLAASGAGGRELAASLSVSGGRLLIHISDAGATYPVRIDPFMQEALLSTGTDARAAFGWSVALSAEGHTALIGAPYTNGSSGAAWIFTRSGTSWSAQAELTGAGEVGEGQFGRSVALSADGSTALIGAPGDAGGIGAAWTFGRSGGTWSAQAQLTGAGEVGEGQFGESVALSGDGQTALIGAPANYGHAGAAWAFTRTGSRWAEQGELIADDESAAQSARFGTSVALSRDGDTALIGGPGDGANAGAAFLFTRSESRWTQQAGKLGTGSEETALFGYSVALSADAQSALIGAPYSERRSGAAFVFTRSGSGWSSTPQVIDPPAESGTEPLFGARTALSADGTTALIDGPEDYISSGAAWIYAQTGSGWTQQGPVLSPAGGGGFDFGWGVALARDGTLALLGGPGHGESVGAAWAYQLSPRVLAPSSLAFGMQRLGAAGSVQWLEVKDASEAPAAALSFTGAPSIAGADAADFSVPASDDLCAGATVAPGGHCLIGVRFTPHAAGPRQATLSLGAGNSAAEAPSVLLKGTGTEAPRAALTHSPSALTARSPISFQAEASVPDGRVESYSWSFGDGSSAEGEAPSHTYSSPGTYLVTLTVTDNLGLQGTVTEALRVRETQLIELTAARPVDPTVGGAAYPISAEASSGLPVSFSSATPATCEVSAASVSFLEAGRCVIDASQAGDSEYAAAPVVEESFTVGP